MCRCFINEKAKNTPQWTEETVNEYRSDEAYRFHTQIPDYKRTPLAEMNKPGPVPGIKSLIVKNEALRFDVKAFKPLGASYAVFHYLKEKYRTGKGAELNIDIMVNHEKLDTMPVTTFCAATDGNHGRAVAWTARRLEQKAVIYMPASASKIRKDNIRKENAELVIVDGTFDDCVRKCQQDADRNGWQVMADTAYEGNMELPRYIIQGYRTIFREIDDQLEEAGKDLPDLVIVPAGVGGLAAAAAGHYTVRYGKKRPMILCVEPDDADCFLLSAIAGKPVQSPGRQESIMVGLACGFPSLAAWPVCRDAIDVFTAIPDKWAVQAMNIYKKYGIISGESGSAGLAGLLALLNSDKMEKAREYLKINKDSRVLCINTEGDTDPDKYRQYTEN